MVFASAFFLFAFLPLTLAAYWLVPRRARNAVLLVASIAFYAWGEGAMTALVIASVLANWGFGVALTSARTATMRSRWLAIAVAVNLVALALFKYSAFVTSNLDALLQALGHAGIAVLALPLPLGISFYTFHAISYLVDVHKGKARAERRIADFALYILMFPQLIAGPIIRWRDIADQIPSRTVRAADVAYGVRRFVIGLAKKVLVANTVGSAADRIFALSPADLTTPLAWLGIVCYTLQIYFDFSGYSDMAIGLMRMLGFRILENFNYPYVSRSIREFWRRWHISLSNWFRDYVYIPLGGNRLGRVRSYVNLAIVFLLCGLWHGASWTFVLWGAWHGMFLVLERAGAARVLDRLPRTSHVYALLVVMTGWVLFRCDTLAHAMSFYAALAGFASGDALRTPVAEYLDPLLAIALACGVVGAMPIGAMLRRNVPRAGLSRGGVASISIELVWIGLLATASAAWLAAGTYNPFIYFRF